MRLLHIWSDSDAQDAKRCAAYLESLTIECHVENGRDNTVELYVHDERDRKRAVEECQGFRENPSAAQYSVTVNENLINKTALERSIEKEDDRVRHSQRADSSAMPHLTFILIALSVGVAIISNVGKDYSVLTYLTFVDIQIKGDYVVWTKNIFLTEVWRFFTPMFVHFGWMHIIFNMLWLKDLGGMIETRLGKIFLLIFVLVASAGSNTLQYYIGTVYLGGSPNFGGMSGVVYALFGFLWLRGRMLPRQGFQLNQQTVFMMVGWFFLCFFLENVANTAHASGLGIGCLWGYFSALRVRARDL